MNSLSVIKSGTILGLIGASAVMLTHSRTQADAAAATAPDHLSLTGKIRDFPPNSQHVDFQVNPSATPGAKSAQNIAMTLDSEMKPVYVGPGKRVSQEWRNNGNIIAWCQMQSNPMAGDAAGSWSSGQGGVDNGGIHDAASFAQWFRDVPGVNMSRLWTINLAKQADGSYMYDTNNFNPVDYQLFGNGFDEHNFYFTYEVACSFTAAANQYLEFKGDDDFWAFISGPGFPTGGQLMLDHGGIAANRIQRVDLNRYTTMVAGQEYKIYMFFAERCQPQSQFRLHTNIALVTAGDDSIFAAFD